MAPRPGSAIVPLRGDTARDIRMRYVRLPEFAPPPAVARAPFHLTFLLPRELTLGVATGRINQCLHQCSLRVDRHEARDYMVHVQGPSRELCFEQARRYLRVAAKGHIAAGAALQIHAVMVTPPHVCAGRDNWTIIVGADVAFAPTGIDADLPKAAAQNS